MLLVCVISITVLFIESRGYILVCRKYVKQNDLFDVDKIFKLVLKTYLSGGPIYCSYTRIDTVKKYNDLNLSGVNEANHSFFLKMRKQINLEISVLKNSDIKS